MPHNGTAVVVVCVTSAAIRLTVPFVGKELSREQAGMAQYLQVPANGKSVICAVNCPEPEVTIVFRGLSWLFITIKLSRLLCKYCDKQITPTDRVMG